ncbi:Ribosomal silencing factor RsfS [Commensalibacter communis]|uniref:Ribosomal silencing factor RsfS n=1 Tax=Commensalibacter communis TaxID=2972786 RepID=A0A9W4TQ13_9PROT|nr:ribosome silencing factor [Commensalibacter communis]CAI3951095.1 Ribosomal silencing factor RsfS [Commensalibacter communis]CAI3951962.1 Ribosomal silencing factor RsfS [Commensalibacter communis]CAI3954553.1 Ribosomal silencing factor RsfS [Commensalibacter communis]CAI3955155.1 Ribosomal silencing factor RsfS [Commensalibacter communis]
MNEQISRKEVVQTGPEKAAKRVSILDDTRLNQVVALMVESLEEDKAENVIVIDLVGKASFADRMIIASGQVDRQILAMATHLDKLLFEQGIKKTTMEQSPDWVLLDAGDIIVHLFRGEAREYYNIEKIWNVEILDAAQASTEEPQE